MKHLIGGSDIRLCARLASTKAKLAKSGVFFATLGPSQQMKGRLFAHHVAVVHMLHLQE